MDKQGKFPYQFFAVTFAWSWLVWLPLVLAGASFLPVDQDRLSALSLPVTIVGVFSPAVGAGYCLITLHAKYALRDYVRSLLDFRLGWRAWFVPILVFGGSTWLAWWLPELWGEPRPAMLLPSIWAFPPYVLLMVLLGGGQEEMGWRGYIQEPLEARLGPWLGNLVLGVIWSFWHLPLFFIPGTSQTLMPFAGFVLLMTGYSWFFAWVRQAAGNRPWATLWAHGWANAFIPLLPTIASAAGAAQSRYWIWVSLTFAIGVITMALRSRQPHQPRVVEQAELHGGGAQPHTL